MGEAKICWDFPLLGTGNESGSNIAAITMFESIEEMDGIGREIGQNSIDAKDIELDDSIPVKMEFVLEKIVKSDYPEVFNGYEEAINNCRMYWENNANKTDQLMDFIAYVEKQIQREEIPMLVVRDYNTKGLKGVNAADNEKSYWNLLVNTEGISDKKDPDSAGSYGIGKNAPFAYSGLNLIFYNTLAKDGGRAFEGVARLVTSQREYNGRMRPTLPIGKYLKLIDPLTGEPILPDDECKIVNLDSFKREEGEFGTDVGVVGFKLDLFPDWGNDLAVSMIKNFILAIMNGKLEVKIRSDKEILISKDTLYDLLYNKYLEKEALKYTRQVYETIKEPDNKQINYKITEENDLTIYIKYKESYIASVSRFRSGGMLVNTTNDVLPHFSVVIIVNSVGEKKLSGVIRQSEPPQHNEWRARNIKNDKKLYNKASRYIREINKKVKNLLEEFNEVESSNVIDSGIGGYLPDTAAVDEGEKLDDELKTHSTIKKIIVGNGEKIYEKRYESGISGEGMLVEEKAHKIGKKRRKKVTTDRIKTVEETGKEKGVKSGSGKLRNTVINNIEHRTFRSTNGVYKLFINSPETYMNVYIGFKVGRDDDKEDSLSVSNYVFNGKDQEIKKKGMIGPITIEQGINEILVSFDRNETLAVSPYFVMEVEK